LECGSASHRDHDETRDVSATRNEDDILFLVAANQAGQEVVYLHVLLKGFGNTQKKPVEILEDNASCMVMSKNPTIRDLIDQDMSMSGYTISVTWFQKVMLNLSIIRLKCACSQNVLDVLNNNTCP
jgi:hypothetical protein